MAFSFVFLRLIFFIQICFGLKCTLKGPKHGTACKVKGRVRDEHDNQVDLLHNNYYKTEPQFVNSLKECAELCARRIYYKGDGQGYGNFVGCKSFRYSPEIKTCQLGVLYVSKAIDTGGRGQLDGDFYDIDCFDCGDPCDQPFNTQLLDNGDFEKKILGPWASAFGSLNKGLESAQAWYCKGKPPRLLAYQYYNDRCQLLQYANACNKSLYFLRFSYKATPTGVKSLFSTKFLTSVFQREIANVETWQTVAAFAPFTRDDRARNGLLDVQFDVNGDRSVLYRSSPNVFIDNVTVARIDKSRLDHTEPGSEAIQNGKFEKNTLSPWRVVKESTVFEIGNFTVASPGLSGSKYGIHYQPNFKGIHETCCYRSPFLRQTVTVEPHIPYILRVNMVLIKPDSDPSALPVMFRFNSVGNTTHTIETQGGAHNVSIPFTSPNATFDFDVQIDNIKSQDRPSLRAIFDNFSIQKLVDVGV